MNLESGGLVEVSAGGNAKLSVTVCALNSSVRLHLRAQHSEEWAYLTPDQARLIARKLNRMARIVSETNGKTKDV